MFGVNDMILIVGCTIKFIDSDETLRNLLCVSREFYEILRDEIYK